RPAGSDPGSYTLEWDEPLVRHLQDSAAVAGELWDNWLPARVREVISAGLPDGERDGRLLLTWVAGLHDLGKATPGFAIKAARVPGNEGLVLRMADQGLACPPYLFGGGMGLPPHCHLGQFILSEWLTQEYAAGSLAATALAAPVGMHHGTPPSPLELQDFRGSKWTGRREDSWRAVQDEFILGMSSRTGALERLPDWIQRPPSEQAQILLTGAVVVADWLASDTTRFRHDDNRPVDQRLEEAGLCEALHGPWAAPPEIKNAAEMLTARFPHLAGGIRPLQTTALETASATTTPGLMVIEAPMGSGKTEAALLAAEELARKFGCGGVFVALPTMATSDAMFGRVLEWTRHLGAQEAPTIFLAHGKARLNEDYRGVLAHSRVRGINSAEDDARAEDAVVTSWLQGRRKGVLANFVVGTIDQVLFGGLKSRHLALRHLALAGKVVVIDEVHAADTYMQAYLVRVLEWLAAYQVPVVLLSATLPRKQLEELTAAYARGRGARPRALDKTTAYPRITVQTDEARQREVPWTGAVTEVWLEVVSDGPDEVLLRVRSAVAAGGCVVVIRNTVRRAQETYAALREMLGAERVSLIHSQFVASHRAVKERELLRQLGPPGPETQRPKGFVVVGTQVLEQSLDIDADLMISDHAPVDLLLQRMGRLHRHLRGEGQRERPEALREARMVIVGAPAMGSEPVLDAGGAAVYGASKLLRSARVLEPYLAGLPIRLPTDISPLVESAYSEGLDSPPSWADAWDKAEDAAYVEDERARSRAKTYRVGEPGRSDSLVGWLDARASESNRGEETLAGQAQVRDTEDNLEVLVVWRDGAAQYRLLPGIGEHAGAALGIPERGPPERHLALSVLGSSVRLPNRITRGRRMDSVIRELEQAAYPFAGWQQSPWLNGQIVMCLDEGLRASVGGSLLRYDPDMGLLVDDKGGADD
ncbi:MAG: CRISPR-associated helicase Cas3', partial [Micrococcales bacterium]|nr:CRISPR-associated helicase Cas3' [Micrococcales bacterium]